MNNISDSMSSDIRGNFTMVVKNRAGEIVDTYSDHNMIVNSAKDAMAKLVCGDTTSASKVITHFGVGTGTASAQKTDTALTNSFKKAISSHSFPTDTDGQTLVGRVTFHWVLDYDDTDVNGLSITEFGLFCADGSMFAHKVRSASIYKDADLSFEGDWTIIF